MTILFVYLYEGGKKRSFADLSGYDMQAIEEAISEIVEFDDFDGYTEMEYATIELSDDNAEEIINKKKTIRPPNYGSVPWNKNVQVEFTASDVTNSGDKIGACKTKLESVGIKTKQEFRKWAVAHHSDKTGTAMSDQDKDVLACGMAVFSDKALGGRRKTKKRTSKRKVSKRKQGTRRRRA